MLDFSKENPFLHHKAVELAVLAFKPRILPITVGGIPLETGFIPSVWRHPYCYLTNPTSNFVKDLTLLSTGVFLPWVSFPTLQLRDAWLDELTSYIVIKRSRYSFSRRVIHIDRSKTKRYEDFLIATQGQSRRKDFRRKWRTLEEKCHGLRTHLLTTENEVIEGIESYLSLEDAGWKGVNKTSIRKLHAGHEIFFRKFILNTFARGNLHWLTLLREDSGKEVAHRLSLKSGTALYSFKSTYDESFKEYSPGLLIELELIRVLFEGNEINYLDSCATPDATIFNRLYPHTSLVESFWIMPQNLRGNVSGSFLKLFEATKLKLRRYRLRAE
jgi:hypothetical protein